MSALAETSSHRLTSKGTAETSAGPNTVETIEVKKINRKRPSRLRRSRPYRHGMSKVNKVRIRSTHTITCFFGRRSRYTPMSGPNINGGRVCNRPTVASINAESVSSYTNQSNATLLSPSPTCEVTCPHQSNPKSLVLTNRHLRPCRSSDSEDRVGCSGFWVSL